MAVSVARRLSGGMSMEDSVTLKSSDAAMTNQPPRTEAGRELAQADAQALWTPAEVQEAICRIEAEMYDLASNEGYHSGVADCKEHDPAQAVIRRELDEALLGRRFGNGVSESIIESIMERISSGLGR